MIRRHKILLVDDEIANVRLLNRVLGEDYELSWLKAALRRSISERARIQLDHHRSAYAWNDRCAAVGAVSGNSP